MRYLAVGVTMVMLVVAGCKSASAPIMQPSVAASVHTPSRPTVAAPSFKLFHHTADSITLVTKEGASDDEIESLIWQLRDAAHARTLDKLDKTKLIEKMVDERQPIVWFHIYRGTKCAAEKYSSGTPPCGGSYHAAGDYTYGDYVNHTWDNGVLLHEGKEMQLWDTDKPYLAPGKAN